ncbi:DUF2683 family protein [Pedobacter alpinus]|uniref:DUF2683 family protein n=1 Tax=Pedobacter alpinus TaxID=1590643 RepID=A0ABW5TQR6_9SPHI
METLIIHPESKEQLTAVKAFLKALKISFEKKENVNDGYNEEFSAKIIKGREDIKNGKGITLEIDDLWK